MNVTDLAKNWKDIFFDEITLEERVRHLEETISFLYFPDDEEETTEPA